MDQNLKWHLSQSLAFYEDAKIRHTTERSRFYKAAFLFLSSVTEMVTFELARNYVHSEGAVAVHSEESISYRDTHVLPASLQPQSASGEIVVARRVRTPFAWSDRTSFERTINIGRAGGYLSKRLARRLNATRAKRNRIHLQSLSMPDHRYTKRDCNAAADTLKDVFAILS